ncbi:DUF3304 domain-containing protein [Pseudomonas putida]|uniref:DUF3304 domain-containing protein n=1 Tax=Pseudomonas putida TaxID=303 RepID=UPI002363D8E6|nr:DUF3304 domain-containing protein [Pseudomonas putida]MDD1965955.1 DUF3304 domain-containing protein [Pseudomonas putida]
MIKQRLGRIIWWLTAATLVITVLTLTFYKPEPKDEGLGLGISILNYADQPLGVVYVNDIWAGGMKSHGGGSSLAGSVGLPSKWRPGLTITVHWQDDELYQMDPTGLHVTEVSIEPYTDEFPSILFLAFFLDGTIKAFPTSFGPGHPDFAGGLQRPDDVCKADPACKARFFKLKE